MTTTSQYEAFFDSLDADGSGKVNFDEAKKMLSEKGHSTSQIEAFFATMDTSGDGTVTKTEFMTAMGCATPEQMKEAALRRAFLAYDKDRSGKISPKELEAVMEECGKDYSEEEVKRMMELANAGDDGLISYDEFIERFFS